MRATRPRRRIPTAMRLVWSIALVGVLGVLSLSGCGGASHPQSVPSQPSSLPSGVRRAIIAKYPGAAYLPLRVPRGFRFVHWISAPTSYVIQFVPRTPRYELTTFAVGMGCRPGHSPMHSFQTNGKTIRWSATFNDQTAWLCTATPYGKQIMIQTGGSVPGGDAPHIAASQQHRDSQTSSAGQNPSPELSLRGHPEHSPRRATSRRSSSTRALLDGRGTTVVRSVSHRMASPRRGS